MRSARNSSRRACNSWDSEAAPTSAPRPRARAMRAVCALQACELTISMVHPHDVDEDAARLGLRPGLRTPRLVRSAGAGMRGSARSCGSGCALLSTALPLFTAGRWRGTKVERLADTDNTFNGFIHSYPSVWSQVAKGRWSGFQIVLADMATGYLGSMTSGVSRRAS